MEYVFIVEYTDKSYQTIDVGFFSEEWRAKAFIAKCSDPNNMTILKVELNKESVF